MGVPAGGSPRGTLTAAQLLMARLGFICFLVIFAMGLATMTALMDENRGNRLAHSAAMEAFKKIVRVNPLFAGLFVNGGLLGMLLCYTKVNEHIEAERRGMSTGVAEGQHEGASPQESGGESEAAPAEGKKDK